MKLTFLTNDLETNCSLSLENEEAKDFEVFRTLRIRIEGKPIREYSLEALRTTSNKIPRSSIEPPLLFSGHFNSTEFEDLEEPSSIEEIIITYIDTEGAPSEIHFFGEITISGKLDKSILVTKYWKLHEHKF